MLPTLLLMSAVALTPTQGSGGLQLTNARNTFGELGGTRPEGKLLPGDFLFVAFDIEGITITPEGSVDYSMALELVDKAGKSIFKNDPTRRNDYTPLAGNKLPARAFVFIGLDHQPGEYTMKVTVTDLGNAAKPSQTLVRKFEVAEKAFGIVAVNTTIDPARQISTPTTGVVGQHAMIVNYAVVGFDRAGDPKDPKKPKLPNVTLEMSVQDEKGQPTVQKPLTFTMDTVEEKDNSFLMQYVIPMTRIGKYTVKLKAIDNLSKKTATFDLPIAVVPPAN
jgi:hypothetical protein